MRFLRLLAALSIVSLVNLAIVYSLVQPASSSAGGTAVSAGDANGDSTVDIADAVYVLSYLFQGGPPPVAIAQTGLTAEQEEILSHLSIEYLDDGVGGTRKTIRVSGVNLQIVSGLGTSSGNPANPLSTSTVTSNGLGNLLIGYDEHHPTAAPDSVKTGSHNLVVGGGHTYSSVGGMVQGFASRSTGVGSVALGWYAEAGPFINSQVLGGSQNRAAGVNTTVIGGSLNQATGSHGGTILGGIGNLTVGIAPGTGVHPTVVGGENNEARGRCAVVSGGLMRSTAGDHDWRAGSLFEDQ